MLEERVLPLLYYRKQEQLLLCCKLQQNGAGKWTLSIPIAHWVVQFCNQHSKPRFSGS
jgi:hypothetical protein